MATRKTTQANAKKYEQQWDVPSDSDPSAYYTVSLTLAGEYVCHCWPFLRKHEPCKHIRKVLAGEAAPRGQPLAAQPAPLPAAPPATTDEPALTLAKVRQVTAVLDDHGTEVVKLKVPQLPVGNDHFLITVLADLLSNGVSWTTLRRRYPTARELTAEWITNYVHNYGRLIYGPWQAGVGFEGFTYVPPEDAH